MAGEIRQFIKGIVQKSVLSNLFGMNSTAVSRSFAPTIKTAPIFIQPDGSGLLNNGDKVNIINGGTNVELVAPGINIGNNTYYIPGGARGYIGDDQPTQKGLVLVGGLTTPHVVNTNPPEFAIIDISNANVYRLAFNAALQIFQTHTNPAISHVNVNGPFGYGGYCYGAIKPDRKELAIIRVITNNINSINSVTGEPSPPYITIYWDQFVGVTLNSGTGLIDYTSVNEGSISLSFPTSLVDSLYLLANVAPPGWSPVIGGGITEHTFFGLQPIIQWDGSGNFSFDLVGYSSSFYETPFTNGASDKDASALVGATIIGPNMQLGGALTQLYNHLQYAWDGSFTAQVDGYVHETYSFNTTTIGPSLQGGYNGWSPPPGPNLTSGFDAPLGIFGPFAFKNSIGNTGIMLTSQPGTPFIHAQYATPYNVPSGGVIPLTPKIGAIDTLRVYQNNALWSDLSPLSGPTRGLIKTTSDQNFSAIRYPIVSGSSTMTLTAYSYDPVGLTITKGKVVTSTAIPAPFAGFSAVNAIMDWQ